MYNAHKAVWGLEFGLPEKQNKYQSLMLYYLVDRTAVEAGGEAGAEVGAEAGAEAAQGLKGMYVRLYV